MHYGGGGGPSPGSSVRAYFRLSRGFWTGPTEPFGLVMVEAMSAGTPVIAFRCGPVPEILTPEFSGFVV